MVHIKIPKQLFSYMLTDIARQHRFAFERVGFLFVNSGKAASGETLILATDYTPVADENYIADPKVGAKINSSAIREVMQKMLDTGHGVLHVHMHDFPGSPNFSRVDIDNLSKLIPSFQATVRNSINGALLVQNNSLLSFVWMEGSAAAIRVNKITIIGHPLEFHGRY